MNKLYAIWTKIDFIFQLKIEMKSNTYSTRQERSFIPVNPIQKQVQRTVALEGHYAGNIKNTINMLKLFPSSTEVEIEIYFENNGSSDDIPVDQLRILHNKIIFINDDILSFRKYKTDPYNITHNNKYENIIKRENNNFYYLYGLGSKKWWISVLGECG